MTQPTPTLLELLEEEAEAFDRTAAAADATDGTGVPGAGDRWRFRATRLRAAATRLLRAISHEQANAGVNEWHAGASTMLAYVVYGTGPLAGLAGPLTPDPKESE